MNAVREYALEDNTIVVFTSDHGDMLFSQNRGWKMKPWAESVNIPFIVRWPGKIPAGRRCDAPVGLVDMMPTLVSLAGGHITENADGKDLSRLFKGDETNAPDSQFIYNIISYKHWSCREWRGVVTRKHTYARFREEEWILYDDIHDPIN